MHLGQSVSVVFPAYNEEDGISQAVSTFLANDAVDEVIVVDNNSRDRTAELAREAGARVVQESRQGYGFALQRGLAEARTDLVIMSEPDGTFSADDVYKLLAYSGDVDLVLGTRTTRELIWDAANMGWFLKWGNWVVAKLLEVLYGTPSLSDVGCTMRLVRREALERFRGQLTVGASHFLPEMVVLARLNGVTMLEVPVNYRARSGESKITGSLKGTLRTGINMVLLILRYRVAGSRAGA
ncbi:MAG TPA: glycosyltransferase family 2 protein [Solirubrobacteraceae bacterium]|nr:glycosyltransferase family 2 protein [Solirubrobacteraceae bacterium]